jgi:hypothetical protein
MFTPLFTPARFSTAVTVLKIAEVIAPQAQTRLAAETCPLYP